MDRQSLDTLCSTLTYAIGVDSPKKAARQNDILAAYIDEKFQGEKADRIFMYNPDAIAEWIYKKYPALLAKATEKTELEVPFRTVMPSVTPVCFATMYTGVQPSVHGIQKYEKPALAIETIFDVLIKSGKKPVIVATKRCSIGHIFLNRDMDYFLYDTIEEVNAKATQIIREDEYDFVVVYNGNYDARMHKTGPESIEALSEARVNAEIFATYNELIKTYWKKHNTLVGFAMDHGCHEIDGDAGSHGLDMPEDMHIVHLYNAYPKCN